MLPYHEKTIAFNHKNAFFRNQYYRQSLNLYFPLKKGRKIFVLLRLLRNRGALLLFTCVFQGRGTQSVALFPYQQDVRIDQHEI